MPRHGADRADRQAVVAAHQQGHVAGRQSLRHRLVHAAVPGHDLVQVAQPALRRRPTAWAARPGCRDRRRRAVRAQRLDQARHAQRVRPHAGAAHAGADVRGRADQRNGFHAGHCERGPAVWVLPLMLQDTSGRPRGNAPCPVGRLSSTPGARPTSRILTAFCFTGSNELHKVNAWLKSRATGKPPGAAMKLPDRFEDVASARGGDVAPVRRACGRPAERSPGDILVLGVGGKMGPTLARMAKRADAGPARDRRGALFRARLARAPRRRTASNASRPTCCRATRWPRLPDAPNVVFMAGRKFGSTGSEWLTWAMNAHVPALVAERFARSRIVAFSTACVYPFVARARRRARAKTCRRRRRPASTRIPASRASACSSISRTRTARRGGCCACRTRSTCATACCTTWRKRCLRREPIDLAMGHANIIWQGEANDWALRALAHCDIADLAAQPQRTGDLDPRSGRRRWRTRLGVEPLLHRPAKPPTAWLVDCTPGVRAVRPAPGQLDTMLDWTADWVRRRQRQPGQADALRSARRQVLMTPPKRPAAASPRGASAARQSRSAIPHEELKMHRSDIPKARSRPARAARAFRRTCWRWMPTASSTSAASAR